jgi:ATP-dependent protease ClpP protease subunit
MDKFIARYEENGVKKSVLFNKSKFDQPKAEEWLKNKGVQNFFFFFETIPPKEIGENGILLKGEVGFDIDLDIIMPFIDAGKDIILDTPGGNSWEALKIYDAIRALGLNPSIGVLGTCASAGMQILLSTENRWMSPNSRGLIHNPWLEVAGDDNALRIAAKNLEDEKLKVANIYVEVSGKTLDEILALMKEERILSANEMLALNFVKSTKWNNLENQLIQTNNETEMNQKETKQLGSIEKAINKLLNKFSPKNIVVQDVNGVELDFGSEVETVEQIKVGDTATAAGVPAEGEHTLADGTIYVFEGGALTEIKEAEEEAAAEVAELQEEVNDLKEEKTELQNKLTASETKVLNLQKDHSKLGEDLTAVKNSFDEFRNKFSGEKPKPNGPSGEGEGGKTKFSYKTTK